MQVEKKLIEIVGKNIFIARALHQNSFLRNLIC